MLKEKLISHQNKTEHPLIHTYTHTCWPSETLIFSKINCCFVGWQFDNKPLHLSIQPTFISNYYESVDTHCTYYSGVDTTLHKNNIVQAHNYSFHTLLTILCPGRNMGSIYKRCKNCNLFSKFSTSISILLQRVCFVSYPWVNLFFERYLNKLKHFFINAQKHYVWKLRKDKQKHFFLDWKK